MRPLRAVLGASALLALAACGPAIQSTFPEQWSRQVDGVGEIPMVRAAEDGEQVLLIGKRNVVLLDGAQGTPVFEEREKLLSGRSLLRAAVGSTVGDAIAADVYRADMLPGADVVLLFDYAGDTQTVRALDLETGQEVWKTDRYSFSPERFTEAAADVLVAALGGTTDQVEEARWATAVHDEIAFPLPDRAGFLFKAYDGLKLLDARTGQERWSIADFKGPGVVAVRELPGGDLVVVGSRTFVGSPSSIARLDPRTGRVAWMQDFEGASAGEGAGMGANAPGDSTAVFIDSGRLVVDDIWGVRAYALDTGRELVDTGIFQGDEPYPHAVVTDALLISAGRPLNMGVGIGIPRLIRAYDAQTGEERWETPTSKTTFHGMKMVGDVLIVSGNGELFDGEAGVLGMSPATGEVLWTSDPMPEPGMLEGGGAVGATEIISAGGTAWVGGATAFVGFDPATGRVVASGEHPEQEVGKPREATQRAELALIVSAKGAAAYSLADGSRVWSTATDGVRGHKIAGEDFFLFHNRGVTQIDPATGEVLGTATFRPASGEQVGNLGDGLYVSENGQALFFLTGSDAKLTVHKYQAREE